MVQEELTLDDLFALFLGHRHQIEHTGDAYPWVQSPPYPQQLPTVSLNHDTAVGKKTRAPEVAAALEDGTSCIVRTTYRELVRDLDARDLHEQLMYFWCHGYFEPNGPEPAQLVIRLTDGMLFDGHTVRERRARHRRAGAFHPFVVLNACHAGTAAGDADRAFLGRVLIEHGAQGVLGPQIEMPQVFAAEYALAFVQRYLGGGPTATAGKITHDLAQHFASHYRNPLGFAYALHCGMDTFLQSAKVMTSS
ncbi:CHAT domain-containing protein [Streptomyces collinus]|uniref:CHAT domain-containing protein n=1 Tax=Streptomyces collinus TaxID=42684 RepID=UPI00368868F2